MIEYMAAGSLKAIVHRKMKVGEREVAVVAYSVLMALQELHSRNILHRDIKVCFLDSFIASPKLLRFIQF